MQGWLKTINNIDDTGKDALSENPNAVFAQDVFNSILFYYTDDYKPLNNLNYPYWSSNAITGLYNGNIAALSTGGFYSPLLKVFRYDKINRIKSIHTATLNGTQWNMPTNAYYTNYVYDFNGNLTSLRRYNSQQDPMQEVQYDYTPNRNRLAHITGGGMAPIASSNYTYDPIGNLINDSGEDLSADWNNAGKVAHISNNSGIIIFDYSPTGQRQRKTANNLIYYYLHDATGNIIAIYHHHIGDTLKLIEKTITNNTHPYAIKKTDDKKCISLYSFIFQKKCSIFVPDFNIWFLERKRTLNYII